VALGQGYDVKLLPLANGDVMAGWLDANGGGAKLRKIGAAGSFAWPAAVTIASPTGSGQVQVGELMEYSNGDVLVIFLCAHWVRALCPALRATLLGLGYGRLASAQGLDERLVRVQQPPFSAGAAGRHRLLWDGRRAGP
jgi:hypothetical protein